jgi:gamma-glutamyl:cysteine ligase YbdK (ATP-grasp superfamily)
VSPFQTVPQRLEDMPPPEVIADLFRDLDEAEREARQVRAQLDQLRQRHMLRERCWGLDLNAFRREIERKAA